METIELTDSQAQRFESVRETLEAAAGTYATVTNTDVVAYLLDRADSGDTPKPDATADTSPSSDGSERPPFPRESLREQLAERNLDNGDSDADEMDLSTIAATYDVTGRSSMTKDELVEGILDTVERRYRDPFDPVDVEFPPGAEPDSVTQAASTARNDPDDENTDPDDENTDSDAQSNDERERDDETESDNDSEPENDGTGEAGDAAQLTAMLDLLETHDDKWGPTNGEARYEVELPDGSVQTARTKDDVRALLFKNY